MLITAFSPYFTRVLTVDNFGDNYVDNLWTKCGKLFKKIVDESYPHLIHTISTTYPHSYPQFFIK